jgi:ferrochelatase
MIDGVLMLGFGGPTPGCCQRRAQCPRNPGCEAECFVAGILGDNPLRGARVQEVVAHYRAIGGFSAYNALSLGQSAALGRALQARGRPLPVAFGFRHWTPWAVTALAQLHERGCREVALVVMAPHQSTVSWDWYLKLAAEASEELGERSPALAAVVAPFWREPGFIDAIVERLREATSGWSAERVAQAALLFTAHAIPRPVEQTSPYRAQVLETAALAARAFGHPAHVIAFQSQPSDSGIPWSAPDIPGVLADLATQGMHDVVVCACGFLVDHTEVLYDLDIEARDTARRLGMTYIRARSVHEHPAFIGMLAERILAL